MCMKKEKCLEKCHQDITSMLLSSILRIKGEGEGGKGSNVVSSKETGLEVLKLFNLQLHHYAINNADLIFLANKTILMANFISKIL